MITSGLPYFACGTVVKGFGRGSKELGIPTANYSSDVVRKLPPNIQTGIYYGWAKIDEGPIYKMVMSIGWNPFYNNKEKTMEIHILHVFDSDFYGSVMKVCVLNYLRPEKNFNSVDELIAAITEDIEIASSELSKKEYEKYKDHEFFHLANAV